MFASSARRLTAALLSGLVGLTVLTGCSGGDDAVVQGQGNEIVAPGGKTVLEYAVDDRKPVGTVSGKDLNDAEVELNGYRGKVVVVNVWASWCPPCRREATEIERVFAAKKAAGVQMLGINFRDNRGAAQDFAHDRGLTFPSIYDYGGRTLHALGVPVGAVPTTVILDRRLRPAVVYLKAVTEKELTAAVDRVLAEGDAER
ncbi:MAG: TlpA disulfide reductase family protein [Gordonia sp. (in: high G+C Gram-positive bacteria)]|uniref:TlpA family protein disulfide reductase n=1 Tax=Gordonia sp. (in: high G+C Gram-positive bacteria) TaxID=84139 RepID=UPI0039E26DAC